MLEEELWISKIAEKAGLDFDISNSLWNTTVEYFERLLTHKKKVSFADVIVFYTNTCSEVLAILPEGLYYLIPPRIEIKVDNISSSIDDKAVALFDAKVLSELSPYEENDVILWCGAVSDLFKKELESNGLIKLKGIADIEPIYKYETIIGINVSIDKKIQDVVNKPFSMFVPVEVPTIDGSDDIDQIKIDSLSLYFSKDKNIFIPFENNNDEADDIVLVPSSNDDDISSDDTTIEGAVTIVEDTNDTVESDNSDVDNSVSSEDENVKETSTDEKIIESEIISAPDRNETKEQKKRSWFLVIPIIIVIALFFIFSKYIWGWVTNKFDNRQIPSIVSNTNTNTLEDTSKGTPKANVNQDTIHSLDDQQDIIEDSVRREDKELKDNIQDSVQKLNKSVGDNSTSENLNKNNSILSSSGRYDANTADTITIKSGDRLTIYALKKYGNKVFWVYIYEENRGIIKNPDNIALGTKLVLPPAKKYNIDPNNTKSVNKALVIEKSIKQSK